MKSHMIAFGGAAQDFSAGLVTVPTIPDPLIRSSGNVLYLNDEWKVLSTWAGGTDLSRLRLSSASSRLRGLPNLVPLNGSHLAGSRPGVNDLRDNPIALHNGETVSLQATNAAVAATIALMNMTRDSLNFNVNAGSVRRVRFTATVISVAYAWSAEANVVLDDDIEAGTYGVYGFSFYEADAIAGRLVFKDQVERPGVIAGQLASDIPDPIGSNGLGMIGSFQSITPPFFQSIHVAAASQSIVGYLLLGKI